MIDTFAGLNPRAKKLVEGELLLQWTDEVTRTYPDGRREVFAPQAFNISSVKVEPRELDSDDPAEYDYAAVGDQQLCTYTFPDGRVYIEKHQAEEERPKPNQGFWRWFFCMTNTISFTALQDEQGNWIPESLWTDEEMEAFTIQ